MQLAADPSLLKGLTRMAIVRHLSAHPGQSRATVSESLHIAKPTVSLLVRELMDEGWLLEREVVATGEQGRPPTPLFINPRRLVLLGAELNVESVRVVATSLTGDILVSASRQLPANGNAKAGVALLAKALLEVCARLDADEQQVLGVGIALPGGVDEASGHLHFAPNLGWRDVPVGALLAAHLRNSPLHGVALCLQNDANVAALGELEFAVDAKPDPLVYVTVSHGVGASVVVGERLLTGAHGFAGEVGHTILQMGGPLCACGRQGCAEAMIGLGAMLPRNSEPASLRQIQRQLAQKKRATEEAVASAGRYLGMLLWNLSAAYDPGCIVLGGPAVELGASFLDPALQTLQSYSGAAGLTPPQVLVSRLGADAVAIGAAALVRYRLTRPLMAASSTAAASAR